MFFIITDCASLVVHGYPGRTKKGELTVQSTKIQILTPCIARLPKGFQKITDDVKKWGSTIYFDF